MVKARSIIEIVGGPKEYVDKAMGIVLDKLRESKEIKLLKDKVFEAQPLDGKKPLFSSFCEIELEVKKMDDLFGFCFDFMPSSVEIYDPAELALNIDAVNEMVNELITKLHQYDMAFKNIYAQNIVMKRQLDELTKKQEKK
ncbi:MAG: hypothetical protein AABX72_05170 [Nanoarchaeota archaeon]